MKENLSNGCSEVIFNEIEEESRVRLSQRSTIENVVDDGSRTFDTSEFFTRHNKITKIAAAVTTAFVLSGQVSAMAETTTKSIEYKQPGSIDQKYTDALSKLLASADTTTTSSAVTESMLSAESVKSPSNLIVQIGSPYYEVTNPITGDVNVLKKMDKVASLDKSGKLITSMGTFDKGTFVVDTNKDKLAKELKYKALQYISGGDMMDAETFKNPLEKLSVGATVVYSSEKNKLNEKKLITKYQSKIKKDDVVYCLNGKAYLVRPNAEWLPSYDGSYREGFYQLDKFNSKLMRVRHTDENISFLNQRYYPYTRVDYKTNTLVATDLLRVTHDYNTTTGKWTERTDYGLQGNAKQRIRENLNKFVDGVKGTPGINPDISNPVGLDKSEVKKYCETGDDTDLKSFKVMKDANGDPAFFVVTGGQCGFNDKMLSFISQAVTRMNEIDPTVIKMMAERNGTNCITYDMIGLDQGYFKGKTGPGGTYETYPFGQIVFVNKDNTNFNNPDSLSKSPRVTAMYIMFVESRAARFRQHTDFQGYFTSMEDVMSTKKGVDNEEADKYRFCLKYTARWLAEKKLTKFEYCKLMSNSESSLQAYDPSYVRIYDINNLNDADFIPEK